MELKKFLLKLWNNRLILVIIPVCTIIIAYFLVRNLPDSYVSRTQIATGLVDETQNINLSAEGERKQGEIDQEFGNLIEMLRMEKMLDQVSYALIIHDLTSQKPYRRLSAEINELPRPKKEAAVAIYRNKFEKREGLNLWDKEQKNLYRVVRSMRYDSESIRKNLRVYRGGSSDFIYIEFESEHPELSAFVVNTLSREFSAYYTSIVKENQRKSVNFLGALMRQKQDSMNAKVEELRDYKIKNKVLNLSEQSSQLYAQSLALAQQKLEAEKNAVAYAGAIRNIDKKFTPGDRRYLESTLSKVNQNIIGTKEELRSYYDRYIDSDFDIQYKGAMDSLQKKLASQINSLADKYTYNPLNTKQELVQQKLNLEIQLDLAHYSVNLINRELNDLNTRFDKLVPHEAVVQSLERDIEVAGREYFDILNRYNLVNMEAGYSIKLRTVQMAMPGLAQPTKKMLLIILSGIISFVFCIVVFLILFLLDNSIQGPEELADQTGMTVLGTLQTYPGVLSFPINFNSRRISADLQKLKDQLRALRFEIDKEMNNTAKILGISSILPLEGKTFVTLTLAESYVTMQKKVLIIDGNFSNPLITHISKPQFFIEDLLQTQDMGFLSFEAITVLGNKGGNQSLLEICKEDRASDFFSKLRSYFDIILIETPALSDEGHALEWLLFTQKLIAVFEAQNSLDDEKKYIELLKKEEKFIGWIFNKMPIEKGDDDNRKKRTRSAIHDFS